MATIESHPLFKTANVDWTQYITVPSYAVNLVPIYDEWTDAARTLHRNVVCYKLEGNFTVRVPNLQEYYALMDDLYASEYNNSGYYLVKGVYSNNTQSYIENVYLFIDLEELQNEEPILGLSEQEGFTVNIKER